MNNAPERVWLGPHGRWTQSDPTRGWIESERGGWVGPYVQLREGRVVVDRAVAPMCAVSPKSVGVMLSAWAKTPLTPSEREAYAEFQVALRTALAAGEEAPSE